MNTFFIINNTFKIRKLNIFSFINLFFIVKIHNILLFKEFKHQFFFVFIFLFLFFRYDDKM